MTSSAERKAAALACWKGAVTPRAVEGGITNANFVVDDAGGRFFVRVGDDIPVHAIVRFHELAASRAAHAAGVSPEVVHAEPGALVLRFIEGVTLDPAAVREPRNLERILALVQRAHREIPLHFRGPVLAFWVFQVIRSYAAGLRESGSRMTPQLPELMAMAAQLESAVGPVELVFGHNDLLAANFIDDGKRLWLVDWDYGGFNSPLFDLGGLASNNELVPEQERELLERYFDRALSDDRWRSYVAMKCASLLRESMWSMVSEIHSTLDFDYVAYTTENLERVERAWAEFKAL